MLVSINSSIKIMLAVTIKVNSKEVDFLDKTLDPNTSIAILVCLLVVWGQIQWYFGANKVVFGVKTMGFRDKSLGFYKTKWYLEEI